MIRTALVLLLAAQMSAVGASFQAKGTLSFVVTDPETHVQTTRDAGFEVERQDPFWTISITGPAGQGSTSFQSFGDSNETIRITRSRGTGAEDTTVVTVDPVPMPIPGGDDAFVIWLTLLSDSYFTKHTTRSFAPFYLLPDYLTDVGVTFPVKIAWNGPDKRWLERGDWFLEKTYPVWENNQVRQRIVPTCDLPNASAVSYSVEEWGGDRRYPKVSQLKRFQPCSTNVVTVHRVLVREFRETQARTLTSPEIPIGSTLVDRRFIHRDPRVIELVYTNSTRTVLPVTSPNVQKLYKAALEQQAIAGGTQNRPTPMVIIASIVLVAGFLAYGTYAALKNKSAQ